MTPYGLNREEAAAYVGFGVTTFDKMVSEGKMPSPKAYGRRKVWCRDELEASLRTLGDDDQNEWDNVA